MKLTRKIEIIDLSTNHTHYGYDSVGNATSVTNALGQVTTFTFDPNGNQTSVVNPLGGTVRNHFDRLNRLISTISPLDFTNSVGFDVLGQRSATTNANNQVTQLNHDLLGRLRSVLDAAQGTSSADFDANGNLISQTDPNGHTTHNVVDSLNRIVERQEPDGGSWKRAFDPVGNVVQVINPSGDIIHFAYNANNWLTNILYSDGRAVMFEHDEAGNTTMMQDSSGTTKWAHDLLNQVTNVLDSAGISIDYTYDLAGNRKSIRLPGNKTVTYEYDSLNRLKVVKDWLHGTTSYDYDVVGRLEVITNANGTIVSFGYDLDDRLIAMTNATAIGTIISSYVLSLDGVGNPIQIDQNEPLLPIFQNQTNIYSYSRDNRITNFNGSIPEYDLNGSLRQLGEDMFQYDAERRLTLAVVAGLKSESVYDGLGARVSVTRGDVMRRFVLDRGSFRTQVLAEADSNGNVTAYYVYGLGLISRITPEGTRSTYHYDPRGSTIALTDSKSMVTDMYAYTTFGQVANQVDQTSNPFRYLGRYGILDDGNGLCYARARFFSSKIGRFLTKDPLTGDHGDGQSLNRYVYGFNNPITFIDSTGLQAEGINSSVGTPGFAESLVPFWGSGRSAVNAYQTGSYWTAGGYTLLAVTDVFLVKSLVVAGGRIVAKLGTTVIVDVTAVTVEKLVLHEAEERLLLSAPKNLADHHIFSQQFSGWFEQRGLTAIDEFTVTVDRNTHLRAIHGKGNLGQAPGHWNDIWREFIDANSKATLKDIFQQAGRMMDEFGLSHLQIHPYQR